MASPSELPKSLGLAAALAGGLLLLHTTFVERGLEVRPDGLLALGTMSALECG